MSRLSSEFTGWAGVKTCDLRVTSQSVRWREACIEAYYTMTRCLHRARYTHLVGLMSAKVTPLLRASFFTVAGLVRTATVLKRLALYSLSMFYKLIYIFLINSYLL